MKIKTQGKTDPYGILAWTVGSDDDFVCFDYYVDRKRKRVLLHAVVNSETGSFIQNFTEPEWVTFDKAVQAAEDLVLYGCDWCIDNRVRYNRRRAWATARTFARCVKLAIKES